MDDERISLDDVPSIADESWLHSTNGNHADDEPDSWEPINLAELPSQPPIQPTLGGVGIVYPGKRHVFSGPQESAKTLAAYAIGIQVVREGGVLMVIDYEMGAYDARDRLAELGATPDEIARIKYLEPDRPAEHDTAEKLLQHAPTLVIIDAAAGAYDMQGLDDNKRADVERFTSLYVKQFWRAGVATIVLDHVVKQGKERGNYAIGSERKVGGADVHLGFEVITPIKRGGHGVYKIVTHKDRPGFLKRGKLADLELRSDADHRITWDIRHAQEAEETFRPTHLMEKVSKYLEGQTEPVSRNNVETTVTGKGEFIRKAIDALVDEKYVSQQEEGQALMLTSERPYREAEDPKNTPKDDPRPTSSQPRPDEDSQTSSPRPPLTGGRDGVDAQGQSSLVPSHDDEDPIPF